MIARNVQYRHMTTPASVAVKIPVKMPPITIITANRDGTASSTIFHAGSSSFTADAL